MAPFSIHYHLGLGVVAQGAEQVLLGGMPINFGAGQSMLTTIDLPVVSHVTQASAGEPFLGMMLTLDARSILQIASEMDLPPTRRDDSRPSISVEELYAALLDALVRLERRAKAKGLTLHAALREAILEWARHAA